MEIKLFYEKNKNNKKYSGDKKHKKNMNNKVKNKNSKSKGKDKYNKNGIKYDFNSKSKQKFRAKIILYIIHQRIMNQPILKIS